MATLGYLFSLPWPEFKRLAKPGQVLGKASAEVPVIPDI
jgi:hypothetical protein